MEAKKPNLNVCIVGHVDSGKSTIVGNLAYQIGVFDKRQLAKLKSEAEARGKGTFAYAYFFDNTAAERQRGITIDITLKEFKLEKFNVNIIDCPGHKDFIKNMVTGAAQADVAVAVAPASDFAAAISKEATLNDHIMISGVMGIKKMIVCVNKIDCFDPKEQKAKFTWIRDEMLRIVKKLHPDKDPVIIPTSGSSGINIAEKGEKFPWFEGWQRADGKGEKIFTLEGALNNCEIPKRPFDKPLRMPITDIHSITGIGTIYTGRVDSGVIRPGMNISFQPANVFGEVKSLQIHRQDQKEVVCGENIGLALKSGAKGNLTQIKKGNVISDVKNSPCTIYPACKARIIVVDRPKGVKVGYCPVMDLGSHHVPAKLAKFISKKGVKDENLITEFDTIENKDTALCVIVPQKPVVMEVLKDFPSLARFALRDCGHIVAIGSVTELLDKDKCQELGLELASTKSKVEASAAKAKPKK